MHSLSFGLQRTPTLSHTHLSPHFQSPTLDQNQPLLCPLPSHTPALFIEYQPSEPQLALSFPQEPCKLEHSRCSVPPISMSQLPLLTPAEPPSRPHCLLSTPVPPIKIFSLCLSYPLNREPLGTRHLSNSSQAPPDPVAHKCLMNKQMSPSICAEGNVRRRGGRRQEQSREIEP